ncbi:MAG: hypothetical protein ACI84R_001298 [Candidatus Azotimanducaceae bacterium]|jgi:hypothetical protein
MPDRAKVMGALCLCAMAYILSEMIKPQFLEDYNFGYFTYVNMLLGVIVGWTFMGKRAGFGLVPAVNNGVTGVISLLMLAVAVQSINEMLRLSMRSRYDGAFDAVLSIIPIGLDFILLVSTLPFWGTAIIGGVLSGLIVEAVWRRWR